MFSGNTLVSFTASVDVSFAASVDVSFAASVDVNFVASVDVILLYINIYISLNTFLQKNIISFHHTSFSTLDITFYKYLLLLLFVWISLYLLLF